MEDDCIQLLTDISDQIGHVQKQAASDVIQIDQLDHILINIIGDINNTVKNRYVKHRKATLDNSQIEEALDVISSDRKHSSWRERSPFSRRVFRRFFEYDPCIDILDKVQDQLYFVTSLSTSSEKSFGLFRINETLNRRYIRR